MSDTYVIVTRTKDQRRFEAVISTYKGTPMKVGRTDPIDGNGALLDETIIDLIYWHHLGVWPEDTVLTAEQKNQRRYDVTLPAPEEEEN